MIRNLAGGIAGLLAAGIVIMAVEYAGMRLFPLPPDLKAIFEANPPDFAQMQEAALKVPLANLLIVLLAYVLGSMAGGFAATGIATAMAKPWPAVVVGVLLTLAGLGNAAIIPHPLWFAFASTLCYLPCAMLGCGLAKATFPGQSLPEKGSPQA